MLNTDVVYKIECKNYDAAHVDQIRRSRISKHRNHINIEDQRLSYHRTSIRTSTDFECDNVKILDQEKILNKRFISEIIFIHKTEK